MLTALGAAFMGKAPVPGRAGRPVAAPPAPRSGYWTTVTETLSNSSKVRVLPVVSQVITMIVVSHAVLTEQPYGVPTTDDPFFRVIVVVLPVRFVVEVSSTASTTVASAAFVT